MRTGTHLLAIRFNAAIVVLGQTRIGRSPDFKAATAEHNTS
jgi:hypothetical protein